MPGRRVRPLLARRGWGLLLVGLAVAALVLWQRTGGSTGRGRAAHGSAAPPAGVLRLGAEGVVDGDTLRLPDGRRVRVLGLDAEEVFHDEGDRREAKEDFQAYVARKRAETRGPGKYGTPAGEEARRVARALVETSGGLAFETDGPGARRVDTWGRLLLHVWLVGGTRRRLFAEEMIRRGQSPYFVKYGRSRRYDRRLAAAEAEARAAGRGIWGGRGPGHYPDYAERLAWWRARADQVDRWRAEPSSPARIDLEAEDAPSRLRARLGEEATVFGEVRDRKSKGTPRILWLRHTGDRDFPVVFFDVDLWYHLDQRALATRYVTVRGRVAEYAGRPEIVVQHLSQISTE